MRWDYRCARVFHVSDTPERRLYNTYEEERKRKCRQVHVALCSAVEGHEIQQLLK